MARTFLWTLFRKDIGRKLTALGLSVGVWFWLAHNLAGERGIVLEMRVVETRREAEDAQVGVPALYVVKPKEFILLEGDPVEAKVTVRGLKTDLNALRLSAVFEIPPEALGTKDEGSFRLVLNNPARFRAFGAAVDDLEISVSPGSIELQLAREDRLTFDLGPRNVQLSGVPRPGYKVDRSRAVVSPSQVELIGPRRNIEAIRKNPSLLVFQVIDLEGQAYTISRQVGLDRDHVDRSVRLALVDSVTVQVPVFQEELSRQLYSVPVHYINEEDLARRGLKVVESTDTVDVQVVGPKTMIGTTLYSDAQLLKKLFLVFDWTDAGLQVANKPVSDYNRLPEAIRIEALKGGGPPEVKYVLEKIASAPTTGISGDSP